MKSEGEISAEYEGRVLLPAIALCLFREKASAKSVFDRAQLANLVEKHFLVRPSLMAVKSAMTRGVSYRTWRVLGEEHENPHVELLANGIRMYVESWRYIDDSDLYALEVVGGTHLKDAFKKARVSAATDYQFNKQMSKEMKGDVVFDDLRDHLSFMFGRHEYQLRGRSGFSKKQDGEADWAKLGGQASVVAVPIAIIAILVAIWLAK